MTFTIPLLGDGSITIHLLTLADADGFIVRVEPHDLPADAEVVFAFGGANGDKGKRNGDIGCENVPVSEFFRFKPEYCRDNLIQIDANRFILHSKSAGLFGTAPTGTALAQGEAAKWDSLAELLDSTSGKSDRPVVVGTVKDRRQLRHWILSCRSRIRRWIWRNPTTMPSAGSKRFASESWSIRRMRSSTPPLRR